MIHLASDFLARRLKKKVVGQDEAVWKLTRAVLENLDHFVNRRRAKKNALIIGPTGSGKSEIARQLAKTLKVPMVKVSITDYTLTGYKGRDPQEIILEDFAREYKRKKGRFENFLTDVLIYYKALSYMEGEPFQERMRLAKLGALMCFTREEKALKEMEGQLPKNARAFLTILEDLEDNDQIQREARRLISGPPFGIVFIDEFDKVLIDESQNSFYTHLQSHILTMVEGELITREKSEAMDTSNITFMLAGSFYHAEPDELIPELKGRLQVRVELKKLNLKDYEKIAKNLFEKGELLSCPKELEVEESFFKELAQICHAENRREYLGARRIHSVISRVEEALNWELLRAPSKIELSGQFLRWALNFQIPEEEIEEALPKRKEERKKEGTFELLLKFFKENGPIIIDDENFEDYSWALDYKDEEGKTLLLKAYEEGLIEVEVSKREILETEVGPGKKLKEISGREKRKKGPEDKKWVFDYLDDIEDIEGLGDIDLSDFDDLKF